MSDLLRVALVALVVALVLAVVLALYVGAVGAA
jgi:hypothetical protein